MMLQDGDGEIIKGISVSNPVDVDMEYDLFTVNYAAKNGFNHIQFIGPIHDHIKGNIDGMILYRKYNQFNEGKDLSYVSRALDVLHTACKRAAKYGIKTYVWHHELELPLKFKEVYPEITNSYGDIEITHPQVKDFLEHKIKDFFYSYPNIDGIVLTLHETNVPLLKLKNQKLDKIARVKYITEILYQTCEQLGKELIVRPFSSTAEDYAMITQAYEEVSENIVVMDKWTQYDWSLTLPHNEFYSMIKKNPLLVEADVFGEYFGKGHLPIMLKNHIAEKFEYCGQFSPKGYVARIDRDGWIPFDSANEVNVVITAAHLNHKDVDGEINHFFETKYPGVANEVRALMEPTEEILRKTIYSSGYYFSELSFFPTLNHSKNHFYFEMMREDYDIASNEWFIPKDWRRGTLEEILQEKQRAVEEAAKLYNQLQELQGKIKKAEYESLQTKFLNLQLVTEIWHILAKIFVDYVQYFETKNDAYAMELEHDVEMLLEKNTLGIGALGKNFYCLKREEEGNYLSCIETFARDIRQSFALEKQAVVSMEQQQDILDYVVCGGAMEGHRLQKEVNFSDTFVKENALCRIPGSLRGIGWCSINAHGWFSYEIVITPNAMNTIEIAMGSFSDELDVSIDIDERNYTIREKIQGIKTYSFQYQERDGKERVRIQFNKISEHMACIFSIKVLK